MEIVIVILAAFFVMLSAALIYMANFAVRPKVHTLKYELDYLNRIDFMQGESLAIEEEHQITTFDGEQLWVGFVPGDRENKQFVVLSHGYTSTRYGMYNYVALLRRLGFNCVIYDNRGHGANKPAPISFSLKYA